MIERSPDRQGLDPSGQETEVGLPVGSGVMTREDGQRRIPLDSDTEKMLDPSRKA